LSSKNSVNALLMRGGRGEKRPLDLLTPDRLPAKVLIVREFVPRISVKRRERCRHDPLKKIAMNRKDARTWLQSSNAIVVESRALIARCFDEFYRLQQAIAEAASAYEASRALITNARQLTVEKHAAESGGLFKQLTEANKLTRIEKQGQGDNVKSKDSVNRGPAFIGARLG
jgi:hypothetical protein